jgi:hypothetical protein
MIAVDETGPDVSVVVVSCDDYADVWPGFFALLFRFWPDRPYPLYLISNHLAFPDERIIPLQVGDDLSWSQTLARALERVPSRYVLLMLEDFYLTAPVDTANILRLHAAMIDLGAVYLRLVAYPKPDIPVPGLPEIGSINKGAMYRTSLQIAIWDRSVLLGLLLENESPWGFEINGSRRSDQISEPFLCAYDGVSTISYRHTVRRGKWLPDAIRIFAPLGITFDLSRRPAESQLSFWWQGSVLRWCLSRIWALFFRKLFARPVK